MAYSLSRWVFCSSSFCKRCSRISCPRKGEAWILAENDESRQIDINSYRQTDRQIKHRDMEEPYRQEGRTTEPWPVWTWDQRPDRDKRVKQFLSWIGNDVNKMTPLSGFGTIQDYWELRNNSRPRENDRPKLIGLKLLLPGAWEFIIKIKFSYRKIQEVTPLSQLILKTKIHDHHLMDTLDSCWLGCFVFFFWPYLEYSLILTLKYFYSGKP